jgi:hypothetical protein
VHKVRDVFGGSIEVGRDPVRTTARRMSKTAYGTRDDAEIELPRLRVVAHEKRLPPKGTSARSVAQYCSCTSRRSKRVWSSSRREP